MSFDKEKLLLFVANEHTTASFNTFAPPLKLYLPWPYYYFIFFRLLHDQSISQEEFINSDQVLSNKLGQVQDTIITVVSNN